MRSFFRNPHIYLPLLVALILFGIAFFVGYVQLSGVESRLALHMNAQGEIDLTGPRTEVFLAAGVAVLFLVCNLIISRRIYGRDRLLSYLLSYVNIWLALLTLVYISSVGGLN
jgi:hypothetical protein